jgi:tetratricopeptide (TPR) repeat protein
MYRRAFLPVIQLLLISFLAVFCSAVFADPEHQTREKEKAQVLNKIIKFINSDNVKFWGSANDSIEKRDYASAIIALTKIIALDQKNTEAYLSRASCYERAGQIQRAIDDYGHAIALDQKNERAYLSRAMIYWNARQFPQAIDNFNRVISLNPQSDMAYGARGAIYLQQKLPEKAIDDLTKSISLDPSVGLVYVNRAAAYAALGKDEKVVADCSKAIELEPTESKAYLYRAVSYMKLGQHTKAIDDFTKAIGINPDIQPPIAPEQVSTSALGNIKTLSMTFLKLSALIQRIPLFTTTVHLHTRSWVSPSSRRKILIVIFSLRKNLNADSSRKPGRDSGSLIDKWC